MKILHLASGNRWTGAAAPAFAEVEALRAAGIDAHYAYVGGYKLEAKLANCTFAHPVIAKAQNPLSLIRTVGALRRLIHDHGFDLIHSHLTWDHVLARLASRSGGPRLVRTFHSRRTLRLDPFTRGLLARTAGVFVVNDDLADAPLLEGRKVVVTPPPLDRRLFTPEGANARAAYGLRDEPVIAVIGKLSKGRGFEAALETFAHVRRQSVKARLLIIGHGEHRPVLEVLSRSLGIEEAVIWAGYHEDDLPEHYRAADLLLFTAAGSDEGHRAVIEALGCGLAAATYPLEGIRTVLGDLHSRFCAEKADPESLAAVAVRLLASDRTQLRSETAVHADGFTFAPASRRLVAAYADVL